MERPITPIKLGLLLLLLAGCTKPTTPWHYDSIQAGDQNYNSSRITYTPPTGYPPLKIEILKMDGEIEGYIYLLQHKLGTDPNSPSQIPVSILTAEERIEETVPVFGGNMKVRLTKNLLSELILSLKNGKNVTISIDGYETEIESTYFQKSFSRLERGETLAWLKIRNPYQ